MFVKNSQETVRTYLNRTRTLTKAEKKRGESIVMVDFSRDEWTLNRMMSVRIVIDGE